MAIQKYPIGLQDFSEVITRDSVYVDKTKFVHKLINTYKYYFLSRPRRFGKSLLLSTLDYLFQGKKTLFEGLFIYDKWSFEEYPVIKISFSNIGYREIPLEEAIDIRLDEIGESYGLSLQNSSNSIKFKELISALHEKTGRQVAVLIDEYDKPLIDYLDKENLHKAIKNRAVLKSFYSILKDADPHLKMVFITGVSKFSQVSIFSDLNNLYDLSTRAEYDEICGISQQELEDNFAEELKIYDKKKIREWYNGYRWHVNGETVYNPYSLLNFFAGGGDFTNFWYSTGTPTFLIKMCREQQLYQFDQVEMSSFKLQAFDIEDIDVISVLFQTGYLTLIGKNDLLDNYILSYPNKEVRQAYLEKLADIYIYAKGTPSKVILDHLLKALRAGDKNRLEETFNLAFAQIPYDLWQKENEHFYHAIVHLLFSLLGVYVQSEVHTQHGRADSIVHFEDNIYCFEFKLDKTAEEAIAQINERGYLEQYKNSGKTLHKIGINFSSEKKKVERLLWETKNDK